MKKKKIIVRHTRNNIKIKTPTTSLLKSKKESKKRNTKPPYHNTDTNFEPTNKKQKRNHNSTHLLVEIHPPEQFDGVEEGLLVELPVNSEVFLQVLLGEHVEQATVQELLGKCLTVLGQTAVGNPAVRDPCVIQEGGFWVLTGKWGQKK